MNAQFLKRVLHSIRPPRCALSGQAVPTRMALSRTALSDLPRMLAYCQHCLTPISTRLSHARVCGKCMGSPKFHRACAPLRFETGARRLIHLLKYRERPGLSATLALLLAEESIRRGMPKPQLLVPMPLHALRLAGRGYNQSALLCRDLSRLLDIPHSPDALRRTRHTPPLAGLELPQRRAYLRGAMRAQLPEGVREIALVDDVLTTGASALEGVRAIRAVRPQAQVQVWTLAHRV